MEWIKISVTVEDVVCWKHAEIQNQFEKLFLALGAPKEMALWCVSPRDGGVDLYMSPGSAKYAGLLASIYGGSPAEAPTGPRLSFLVGHDDARKMLSKAS